ncbi:MAG TPA: hypothetical protein PKA20_14415 [Burkholderiaceae bacterium]|nr:hypothetical protein [Burkholderiaceae bacterium]
MFGRSRRPTVFKPVPYMRPRSRWRVPRWLMILVTGIALGVGGLMYLQARHLPKGMSPDEAQRVLGELDAATKERDRLKTDLQKTTEQLQAEQGEGTRVKDDLGNARRTIDRLQKDLAQFVQALPPDPRGSAIAIRAASFSTTVGQIGYHIVFTRARKSDDSFKGVMQLVVTGQRGGREETVPLSPVPMTVEAYQHMSGTQPLPEGFAPREVTIRVLRGPGGEMLSMRVFKVA